MLGFGVVLAVLLVLQVGADRAAQMEITPALLRTEFPWFGPVQFVMLAAWHCLAAFGLLRFFRSAEPLKASDGMAA
jgi:hypothetical protein